MELIYILTYDCNFRCSYCDIHKRPESMDQKVLEKSFDFLSQLDVDIHKVKFFGGEPLMKKVEIQRIVSEFPQKFSPDFYVTSNSTLVTPEFVDFVKTHDVRLTFSLDGESHTNSENRSLVNGGNLSALTIANTKKYSDILRINQVITDKNAKKFFQNFLFIYDLGIRQFNFLPEYYRDWTKSGLKQLQEGFSQIEEFYKEGNSFHLVNAENYSETAFFNLGIIIDTDGSIYGTNLILSGIFEKYKPILKIGKVEDGIYFDMDARFQQTYMGKVHECLRKEYSVSVLRSVEYVDKILSNFTKRIEAIK